MSEFCFRIRLISSNLLRLICVEENAVAVTPVGTAVGLNVVVVASLEAADAPPLFVVEMR